MSSISQDIQNRVEEMVGYRFQDLSLLTRALTHASVADNRIDSNERMEFLGDAIFGAVVCEYLYHAYPESPEGELTKIKSAVVSRQTCALVAVELGLSDLLSLGKGMSSQESMPSSLAAAAFEAMVAAIYLDGGIEPAQRFILTTMKPQIELAVESSHQENFKSLLQQHAQREMSFLPNYLLLDEKGPDHAKCFEICVEINGRRFVSAWGQTKKAAEQKAAMLALQALGVLIEDDQGRTRLADPPVTGP